MLMLGFLALIFVFVVHLLCSHCVEFVGYAVLLPVKCWGASVEVFLLRSVIFSVFLTFIFPGFDVEAQLCMMVHVLPVVVHQCCVVVVVSRVEVSSLVALHGESVGCTCSPVLCVVDSVC